MPAIHPVEPPDRALPERSRAGGPCGGAAAGRRDGTLRDGQRPPLVHPTARFPRGARAADEGLLALPPPGVGLGWTWAGGRGGPRPRGRRLPPLAGGARALPRHLPQLGTGVADASPDARGGLSRALPARVGRADLPRPVRRLSQVHGGPALAHRRGESRGARAGRLRLLRGDCPGAQRGPAARPSDAGHAPARHRQGQGARPRRQGHPARRGADGAHRARGRSRGRRGLPGGPARRAFAHRPAS